MVLDQILPNNQAEEPSTNLKPKKLHFQLKSDLICLRVFWIQIHMNRIKKTLSRNCPNPNVCQLGMSGRLVFCSGLSWSVPLVWKTNGSWRLYVRILNECYNGKVRSGMVWFGLVWFGLVWFGSVWKANTVQCHSLFSGHYDCNVFMFSIIVGDLFLALDFLLDMTEYV